MREPLDLELIRARDTHEFKFSAFVGIDQTKVAVEDRHLLLVEVDRLRDDQPHSPTQNSVKTMPDGAAS